MDTHATSERVVIVGAGVAGLTAGIFTARAGLETTVVEGGESILARNAFLENFPGFPAGVDARLLLEMVRDQAERSGCQFQAGTVTAIEEHDDEDHRFSVSTESARLPADFVLCTSWADTDYLTGLDVGLVSRGSKTYVDVDERGSTGVDGLYAAGRIAEKPHQTIVAAGHGADVAMTLIDDAEVPFYHDWVAPENYFTGRGREVPPGCEEIDDEERREREAESRAVMQDYFDAPHPGSPTQHPSVDEDE